MTRDDETRPLPTLRDEWPQYLPYAFVSLLILGVLGIWFVMGVLSQ
jgi:hypothetical protein